MSRAETDRIRGQLRRAVHGDAWHGPSVLEAAADLPADIAWTRLTPDTHSPAELVLHIAAWFDIVRRRLAGDVVEPTTDEDWPPPPEQGPAACAACIRRVVAAHAALDDALADADDERLAATVPGQQITVYAMLHGAVQHATYHAGQIMLIRRAVGN